ncbi:helix-turn-helix domain-containing protein, partial [Mycolicibacterium porcinum]|uniref:helix-turn-helix domain-containing protein n=1 Tax=Mycolicibacterium porcinum TaxID=39693 RepID=UPI000A6C9A5E
LHMLGFDESKYLQWVNWVHTFVHDRTHDEEKAAVAAVELFGERVPREMIMRSRDYDDEQWTGYVEQLRSRGWLDARGELTDAGRDIKQAIEDRTDVLALGALGELTDDEITTLFRVLTPITRLVVAAGDVPAATPMGLNRDNLDDDSADLG